jgi:hypothetical protein
MDWDTYKARYKALERYTLRGGLIGFLTLPWPGVAAGLLGIIETEYRASRATHAVLLGAQCAMTGFCLGSVLGAIFGVWKQRTTNGTPH